MVQQIIFTLIDCIMSQGMYYESSTGISSYLYNCCLNHESQPSQQIHGSGLSTYLMPHFGQVVLSSGESPSSSLSLQLDRWHQLLSLGSLIWAFTACLIPMETILSCPCTVLKYSYLHYHARYSIDCKKYGHFFANLVFILHSRSHGLAEVHVAVDIRLNALIWASGRSNSACKILAHSTQFRIISPIIKQLQTSGKKQWSTLGFA